MTTWTIYPLDVGELDLDQSEITMRRGMGTRVHDRFIAYYLTDGTHKVLVDAGPPDAERSRKYHQWANPTISKEQEMQSALKTVGVTPDEIELVFLTHLHWDHVGQVTLFNNARFVVSETEWSFAVNPVPTYYVAYEALQMGVEPLFLKIAPRLTTVKMAEQPLLPGLVIFPTPGHTPGHMAMAVETSEGPYVIAGDAVGWYANLKGDPDKGLRYLPSGIYTDVVAMWNSIAAVDAKALHKHDHVLPGHDSQVFRQRCYPAGQGEKRGEGDQRGRAG